ERDQTDIAGMSDSRWNGAYDPYFIQTEKEVIQSERVLGKVVESLKLEEAWSKDKGEGRKLSKQEALQLLKKKLDVHTVPKTSLLEIGAKSDSPEEAAKIANAVALEYTNQRLEQKREMSRGGIK